MEKVIFVNTLLLVGLFTLAFQHDKAREDRATEPTAVVELKPEGDELKFATTEIKATAGTELTIKFVNTSSLMPHTVVVLKDNEAIEPVGMAAMEAQEHGYIPQDHLDRIIAATEVAQPGETVEVTFTVPAPGEYPYICTFPGHYTLMQGILIVE